MAKTKHPLRTSTRLGQQALGLRKGGGGEEGPTCSEQLSLCTAAAGLLLLLRVQLALCLHDVESRVQQVPL